MSETKVSVIIPVYNAGEYLATTLDSVCKQTLREIEIICVDDGSTDNSTEIINEYILKDNRISLIRQANLFAGAARNNGLSRAKGDYIIFWDSDDFFAEKALEIMYNKMTEDEADICLCNAFKYYSEFDKSLCSDEFVNYAILPETTPFNRKDIPDKIFNMGANVPWNKMFRTAFIRENGLEFQPVRQANDTYFVLMAIFLAEKITYVKNRLVHYRCDSEGSITSGKVSIPPGAFEAYFYLKTELEKQESYTEENKKSFINRAARGMLRILHLPAVEQDYMAVREFLIIEGFEKLGLLCEKDVYDAQWVYNDIQSVYSRTPTEHMIYKFGEARKSKDKIKSTSIKRKQQLDKKTKQLEKAEADNAELKQRVASLQAQLNENKEKLKQAKTELKKERAEKTDFEKKYRTVNASFMALRKKWYVRLFVKLENILKSIKKSK